MPWAMGILLTSNKCVNILSKGYLFHFSKLIESTLRKEKGPDCSIVSGSLTTLSWRLGDSLAPAWWLLGEGNLVTSLKLLDDRFASAWWLLWVGIAARQLDDKRWKDLTWLNKDMRTYKDKNKDKDSLCYPSLLERKKVFSIVSFLQIHKGWCCCSREVSSVERYFFEINCQLSASAF